MYLLRSKLQKFENTVLLLHVLETRSACYKILVIKSIKSLHLFISSVFRLYTQKICVSLPVSRYSSNLFSPYYTYRC